MNLSEKFPHLHQFFSCYFYPYSDEEIPTPEGVSKSFLEAEQTEWIRETAIELKAFLSKIQDNIELRCKG